MAKIFISYRREDSQHAVDRLHNGLKPHVADPARDIFIDVDNIPLGVDFVDHLDAKVGECEILLAVIGSGWLTVTNPATGARRIDDPKDFVRIEIASALKRGIPVVPILLDDAPVPMASQLPMDLQALATRNGTKIQRLSFDSDVTRLARGLGLKEVVEAPAPASKPATGYSDPAPEKKRSRTPLFALIAVLLLGLSGTGLWAAGLLPLPEGGGDVETAAQPEASNVVEVAVPERVAATDTDASLDPVIEDTPPPVDPDRIDAVRDLQSALKQLGYYASTIDGEAGPGTQRAATRFASANGFMAPALTEADTSTIRTLATRADTIARLTPAPPLASMTTAQPYRTGQIFQDPFSGGGRGPEMVVIPSGSFRMGSPSSEAGRDSDEGPQRPVRMGYEFAVGKYEVTWAEWEACVSDGECDGAGPVSKGGDEGWGKGTLPVINVDWNDAQAYVRWLSVKTGERYRLLSEAEWEYVARAGTTTPFSFGTTISTHQANYNGNYTYGSGVKGEYRQKTVPVGSFSTNPFGLYDMHGNVWEWTEDCWSDSYSGAPSDGSAWTGGDCSRRVVRGGSWGNVPQSLRSANRYRNSAAGRYGRLGFRVARTL